MRPLTILATGLSALALSACSGSMSAETNSDGKSAGGAEVMAEVMAVSYEGPSAPDFTLTDTDGTSHTLSDYRGKTVVLEWFNPGCPVTRSYHTPERKMAAYFGELGGDDLVWLAINSGAPGKQGHGLAANQQACEDWQVSYPLLIDESGEVGRLYEAKTTPHMFVISPDGQIVYDGAIDDSRVGDAGTNYVLAAVSAMRAGEAIAEPTSRPFGCSVKFAD